MRLVNAIFDGGRVGPEVGVRSWYDFLTLRLNQTREAEIEWVNRLTLTLLR